MLCAIWYIFTKKGKIGLYNYIKAQNPNVLEGYTKGNRKIINKKYKNNN